MTVFHAAVRRLAALSFLALLFISHSNNVATSIQKLEPTHTQATITSQDAVKRQTSDRMPPQISNQTASSSQQQQSRRHLFKLSDFLDPKSTTERIAAQPNPEEPYLSIAPYYSLYNILQTLPYFRRELFILHYSATSDQFHIYINEKKDGWVSALQNRIYQIMPMLCYALRHHFPHRFDESASDDFVVLVSSGDEPKLVCDCVGNNDATICNKKEFAPLLQFGAVFRDEGIVPSCVTMPVWHHLPCFRQWQQSATVCPPYKERAGNAGFLLDATAVSRGMPMERIWENLIPQIVWRGSDFGFLWCVHPQLRLIDFGMDIAKRISLSQCRDSARGILQCLSQLWEILTPRWRAVFWTMEAELDLHEISNEEGNDAPKKLPWIDAKFTVKTHVHGHALDAKRLERYAPYNQYGLSVASPEFMTLAELSQYRYHFDIGGGGGTTFSGTIDKLSMPGVLFHHVTSTKDYWHDDLVPWMHYIPVEEGLSDLREMYEWALANDEQAMRISETATEYVKSWAEPTFMEAMYKKYFVHTLGQVVDAYESANDDVGEVLKGRKWTLIAKCSGHDLDIEYTREPGG